jgi:putative ABC transport system permease protein
LMLGSDFVTLLSFSLLAGIPIAWYLSSEYLADYAFRTQISWSTYLSTSLFMLIVTLLSVGYQSLKAATANPVDSLRNE